MLNKSITIGIRVTAQQKIALQQLASDQHRTLGNYLKTFAILPLLGASAPPSITPSK